jgi:FdrA protein
VASGFLIRPNEYYDSVFLMSVNKRLGEAEGVLQTAVLMGSENNKRLLSDLGIRGDEIDRAKPGDLIVGVIAESDDVIERVLSNLGGYLIVQDARAWTERYHSLGEALNASVRANLAVLSIPGEYVFREAYRALEAGLHAFIFSSNVPVEEELRLKQFGKEKNLLVMGPDCGTSILGGKGIGFSNAVREGAVGAIGPSGTGLQEFTTQIHHAGAGISHAIGTGTRDLSSDIGGITTIMALEALEDDAATEVIAIVAKPPDEAVLTTLFHRIDACTKPVVGCLLGIEALPDYAPEGFHLARTIDEAVEKSLGILNGRVGVLADEDSALPRRADDFQVDLTPGQRYIRGLFAGGTFCYQAQQILAESGLEISSNAPIGSSAKLEHYEKSRGHTLIDMGDEEYTLGKPHPMIDGTARAQRIMTEGQDPETAVILLDLVLGYNASVDPAGELTASVLAVKEARRAHGAELVIAASICGTENDPQDLEFQRGQLEKAGVIVFESNAKATRFCRDLVKLRK